MLGTLPNSDLDGTLGALQSGEVAEERHVPVISGRNLSGAMAFNVSHSNTTLAAPCGNSSNGTAQGGGGLTLTEKYLFISVEFFLFLSSVSLNSLVLVAVKRFRRLRKTSNLFIMALAVADLLVGLTMPYLASLLLVPQLIFDKVSCFANTFLIIVTVNASLTLLLLVTVDRYIAVTYPIRYQCIMTGTRARYMIVMAWTYAFLWSVAGIITSRWGVMCAKHTFISLNYALAEAAHYALVVLAAAALYMRIFVIAYQHNTRRVSLRSATNPAAAAAPTSINQKMARNAKSARMFAITVGTYIVCYTPLVVTETLIALGCGSGACVTARRIAFLLSIANSSMNPLIYVCMNQYWRHAFRQMCCSVCPGTHDYIRRLSLRLASTEAPQHSTYSLAGRQGDAGPEYRAPLTPTSGRPKLYA